MPRRRSRPRLQVQRLPLGLFGYRKEDVIEAASQMEAEQQGAAQAMQSLADGQRNRIAQAVARREALQEVLGRLRSDRERLERQLDQARRNAAALDEGARSAIAALQATHDAEQARIEAFIPEVDRQIAAAETELRQLAQGLRRLLHGLGPVAGDAADALNEFADVIAALCAAPFQDLPVRRLAGDRALYALPPSSVRLQVRGGSTVGTVHGVVASGLPPSVVGFTVSSEGADGVVPATDVVALLQGAVLVRDTYRIVGLADLPRESSRLIFSVARQQPTSLGAAAGGEAAGLPQPAADLSDAAAAEAAWDISAEAPGAPVVETERMAWARDGAAPSLQPEEPDDAGEEVPPCGEGLAAEPAWETAAPLPEPTADPGQDGAGAGRMAAAVPEQASAGQVTASTPDSPAHTSDEGLADPLAGARQGDPVDEAAASGALQATVEAILAEDGPTTADASGTELTHPAVPVLTQADAEVAASQAPAMEAEICAEESGVQQAAQVDRTVASPGAASGPEMAEQPACEADGLDWAAAEAIARAQTEAPSARGDMLAQVEPAPDAPSAAGAERAPLGPQGRGAPVLDWPAGVPMPDWQMALSAEDEARAGAEASTVAEEERRPAAQAQRPGTAPAVGGPYVRPVAHESEPARIGSPRPAVAAAGSASLNILAFIAGKVVGRDLVAPDGGLLAARGENITPELVAQAESLGLLPEMIVYMTLPEAGR